VSVISNLGNVLVIFELGKKLLAKLQKPAYRHAYVAEHVRRGIAYQIRALRDQRGWSQGKFSSLLGKPQSVVSRLEDPGYGKLTLQTLLEVANVYDVALEVRFVPYSSFLQRTRDVSAASMYVAEFKDDAVMNSMLCTGGSAININVTGQSDRLDSGTFAVYMGGTDQISFDLTMIGSKPQASGVTYVQ
jgi:transcriptional regulator with XRE-family HTH domain